MVICKYFLQGNCRFGDNCRNEHPASGVRSNSNRFGSLSGGRFGGSPEPAKSGGWNLDLSQVRKDLGDERPSWILSSFGGAKNTPASLFEENEYSPEEIRFRFYELAGKGQEAQADQEAIQLWSKADQDLKNALDRVGDIEKFMSDAEKKHPNRYDFLNTDGTKTKEELAQAAQSASNNTAGSSGFGTTPAFGQTSATANSFGKPATASFGQASGPSLFGGSSFGKPAQTSGFGQPSFGQAAASTSSSTFGQPSTTSAFGQPATASAFGKPAFGASGFGQQSQTTSAFGQTAQPSAFGQPTKSGSAFGQSSQPASAFGQPSASGFGQTGFGQTGFGQGASAFGQTAQPASGFGQSPFGKPALSTSSPFGQNTSSASPFGAGTSNAGGFGQNPQPSASPFGMQTTSTTAPETSMMDDTPTTQTGNNPFSAPMQSEARTSQSNPFNATNVPTNNHPSAGPASQALNNSARTPLHYNQTLPTVPNQSSMDNKLSNYKGQRVQYVEMDKVQVPCYNRPDRRGPERIWYPEAGTTQEVAALNREDILGDLQGPGDVYTDDIKAAYKHLVETGKFEPGKMPAVPPMRTWIEYNL